MKRYIKSAVILLAALSLAGCSKTDEFQYNPDSALQIESVSGISPFSLMQEPASKAVISGETLPVDEAAKGIGLFVTASNGGAYDGKTTGYSNVNYTYSASKWNTATPVYLSNTTGKLYGYFPYSADATDLTAVPVASSLNGTDYLYATKQDVSFSNKSVNLQMNHALTRLHLTLKKGDKYLSDCNLTKIVLQSKAIDANGTLDINTGAVTATKAADATGTFTLTGSDAVAAAGITKDILLVPADNTESKKDLTLILTIDGVDAEVKFTAYKGLDIRSGIQNNVTLTVEDTGIKVEGVGVGAWGDGGSQTVEVNGHTVTVKLADDAADAGIADDVLTNVKVDGGNVIIKANSFQDKLLICSVEGDAHCERTITNGKFTFIISSINSEIIAVLAYAPYVEVKVLSDTNGKVWIGDDENKTTGQFQIGQQVVIHAAPNDNFRLLRWNDNNRETSRTITVGDTDTEYSASFISSDLIPGLFTVSSGKQVFFSKGNLYCSGVTFYGNGDVASMANAKWGFEANQYDTNPTTDQSRDPKHISHFLWCADESNAVCEKYNNDWNVNGVFLFTNADATTPNPNFAVNGKQGYWRVLSGGTGGEWDYLLNTRTMENSKPRYTTVFGVSIGGVTCNGLFIYPDDYSGNEVGASGGPGTWADINAAGIVFLPAAGFRYGDSSSDNPAIVYGVGNFGYYWSASPNGRSNAYDMDFYSGDVSPSGLNDRSLAYSVRLVTESK